MSNVTRGRYTYYRMIKDGTALIIAVAFGHFEVVRYLLEQGADRDKAVRDGATPLHYAAEYGRLKIAKLLMVYGADFNVRDRLDSLFFTTDRHENSSSEHRRDHSDDKCHP